MGMSSFMSLMTHNNCVQIHTYSSVHRDSNFLLYPVLYSCHRHGRFALCALALMASVRMSRHVLVTALLIGVLVLHEKAWAEDNGGATELYEQDELLQQAEVEYQALDSGGNAGRVFRDAHLLLEAEEWLALPHVAEFMEAQIEHVVRVIVDEGHDSYGIEFSPKLGNVEEGPPTPWPRAVGTVRITGFAHGTVFRIYETHPNSIQRMRVVRGVGTWYLLAPSDSKWEATTFHASSVNSAPLELDMLPYAYQIADPTSVHFLEAITDATTSSPMVVLCWHEAFEVEDVHMKWEDDPEACDAISPYWRQWA